MFVNAALVREGLARVSARAAADAPRRVEARRGRGADASRRGMWGTAPPRSGAGLYSQARRPLVPRRRDEDHQRAYDRRRHRELSLSSTPQNGKSASATSSITGSITGRSGFSSSSSRRVRSPSICSSAASTRAWRSGSAVVLVGTGIAGLRGALPGVEPKPYIIRFTEDRPNPLYRRVCYTFAWSEVITFAVLNIAGLVVAIVTGGVVSEARFTAYAVLPARRIDLAARRARAAAARESRRRKAKATSGAISTDRSGRCAGRSPRSGCCGRFCRRRGRRHRSSWWSSSAILAFVGNLARLGRLPRTRPIVPGELAVS